MQVAGMSAAMMVLVIPVLCAVLRLCARQLYVIPMHEGMWYTNTIEYTELQ
jgi:hypothetical protein